MNRKVNNVSRLVGPRRLGRLGRPRGWWRLRRRPGTKRQSCTRSRQGRHGRRRGRRLAGRRRRVGRAGRSRSMPGLMPVAHPSGLVRRRAATVDAANRTSARDRYQDRHRSRRGAARCGHGQPSSASADWHRPSIPGLSRAEVQSLSCSFANRPIEIRLECGGSCNPDGDVIQERSLFVDASFTVNPGV